MRFLSSYLFHSFFYLFTISIHSQNDKYFYEIEIYSISKEIIYCAEPKVGSFLSEIDWTKSGKDLFDSSKYLIYFKIIYESKINFNFKEEIYLRCIFKEKYITELTCLNVSDEIQKNNIFKCTNKISNDRKSFKR